MLLRIDIAVGQFETYVDYRNFKVTNDYVLGVSLFVRRASVHAYSTYISIKKLNAVRVH